MQQQQQQDSRKIKFDTRKIPQNQAKLSATPSQREKKTDNCNYNFPCEREN